MYHTTGFAEDEIIDLCALVYANEENCDIDPWPASPGLYKSVVTALTYMRRNRVQQELAETYKTSQPTISRATEIELSGLSQRVTALHGAVVTGAAGEAIAEV